jgi:transcriptional regulator with XRE-family HTH domain
LSQDDELIPSPTPRKKGWSQEELGARASLHRTYIGAIERCEENITLQTFGKLANALEVEPRVLLAPPAGGVGKKH